MTSIITWLIYYLYLREYCIIGYKMQARKWYLFIYRTFDHVTSSNRNIRHNMFTQTYYPRNSAVSSTTLHLPIETLDITCSPKLIIRGIQPLVLETINFGLENTSLLNILGHITTMPNCSGGTLTNMLLDRNAMS